MRRIPTLLSAALLSAAFAAPAVHAQHGNNALHAEVGGAAVLGSINYERVIGGSVSARVGLGWLPGLDYGDELLAPLMLNFLAGRGVHRLEVGAGAVLAYALGGEVEGEVAPAGWEETYAAGTLAYRMEPAEGSAFHGGIYRVGFTPVYNNGEMYPLFGVSAGFYLSALRKSDRQAALRR